MAESALRALLTPEQVAEFLGIPKRSLYVQRSTGRPTPKAIRVGKHLRYRPADVEAFVAEQTEAAT